MTLTSTLPSRNASYLWLALAAAVFVLRPGHIRAEQAHHQGGTATIRSGQVFGQPWEEQRGLFRSRLFLSYLDSRSKFDSAGDKGELDNHGRFTNWALNLFGEYAITNRWSASLFLPIQRSTLKSDLGTDSWTSLGDVYGWGRYRFSDRLGLSPAVLAGVKIPGNYKTVSGVGDGQTDYEAQGFLTKNISGGHYWALNSGYRYRTGSPSDEIIYGGQFGWAATLRWLFIPGVNGVKGIGSGVQKDFLNTGLTVYRTLRSPWSLLASYNRILAGKNTVGADVWALGVSYR